MATHENEALELTEEQLNDVCGGLIDWFDWFGGGSSGGGGGGGGGGGW